MLKKTFETKQNAGVDSRDWSFVPRQLIPHVLHTWLTASPPQSHPPRPESPPPKSAPLISAQLWTGRTFSHSYYLKNSYFQNVKGQIRTVILPHSTLFERPLYFVLLCHCFKRTTSKDTNKLRNLRHFSESNITNRHERNTWLFTMVQANNALPGKLTCNMKCSTTTVSVFVWQNWLQVLAQGNFRYIWAEGWLHILQEFHFEWPHIQRQMHKKERWLTQDDSHWLCFAYLSNSFFCSEKKDLCSPGQMTMNLSELWRLWVSSYGRLDSSFSISKVRQLCSIFSFQLMLGWVCRIPSFWSSFVLLSAWTVVQVPNILGGLTLATETVSEQLTTMFVQTNCTHQICSCIEMLWQLRQCPPKDSLTCCSIWISGFVHEEPVSFVAMYFGLHSNHFAILIQDSWSWELFYQELAWLSKRSIMSNRYKQIVLCNYSAFLKGSKPIDVILRDRNMAEVPSDLPDKAREVDMTNNKITSLPSGVFSRLKHCAKLSLKNNSISMIQQGSFIGLDNLEDLLLSNNRISHIDPGAFKHLPFCVEVDLGHNNISFLANGSFAGLFSLMILNLGYNKISRIQAGLFTGLSSSKLMTLNLFHNNIVIIEKGSFAGFNSAGHLWLNGNKISVIEAGSFPGVSHLSQLGLSKNRISTIEDGSFKGLDNLRTLILEFNRIVVITFGMFAGLEKLDVLDLSYNKISSFEKGCFTVLKILTSLSLQNNKIIRIEPGFFTRLNGRNSFKHLWLYANDISVIENKSFSTLKNLESLTLNYNCISELHNETFFGLSNLKTLSIKNNRISKIKQGTFAGMKSLIDLYLSANKIHEISPGTFMSISQCTILLLLHNIISSIVKEAFVGLESLTELVLANNRISTVEVGAFLQLHQCTSLRLENNNISFIAQGAFCGLKMLKRLNLSNNNIFEIVHRSKTGLEMISVAAQSGVFNQISQLSLHNNISLPENDTFAGMYTLWSLDLDNNKFSVIDSESFVGLNNVETLSLVGNNISVIKSGAFTHLAKCTALCLSQNSIAFLERGTFREIKNLTILSLAFNRISVVEAEVFNHLNQCTWLNLDGNKISVIEAGAFDAIFSLRHLSLCLNRLTSLSPVLFINLPRPLVINLSSPHHTDDNLWNCSSLCWLYHEEKHGTMTVGNPGCADGDNWTFLECGDSGKFHEDKLIDVCILHSKDCGQSKTHATYILACRPPQC